MTAPAHSTTFEKAIHVTPIDTNTYSAHLDPSWCIGHVPHGGYTASVLYRTATTHFVQKAARAGASKTRGHKQQPPQEPIGLQITFQRRTFAGPAILSVQEIKLGARVSTIHVTLSQARDERAAAAAAATGTALKSSDRNDLEVKVLAYVSLSPPAAEEGPAVTAPWDLAPAPPPGSLAGGAIDFKSLSENGVDGEWKAGPVATPTLHAAKHVQAHSPASTLRPKTVEERAKQVVDQWSRFAPGGVPARWSNEAVVYLADLFPAALDRLGALEETAVLRATGGNAKEGDGNKVATGEAPVQFWYPTVTMNFDLKTRLPREGVEWLHTRVVTRMLRGSRADLEVLILDQDGGLVATSTQVALVVDPARNGKGRGEGKL
ncbi:thioesterase-like superfamily-domain-containing protein [Aspergillus pseudodeflectus]|uniref:Thioesterase-like superfamily-domain-containing protein n=1 Tax=Aspergillus pseudodeflectus TaxID=176178 RepID=A0ABR4L4F3_9EURO